MENRVFRLYCVFKSGHTIFLNKYQFERSATDDAKYHHEHAMSDDCHFIVVNEWFHTVYITKKA